MNPITVALVYLVVSAPASLGFKLFKANFDWIDIAIAFAAPITGCYEPRARSRCTA